MKTLGRPIGTDILMGRPFLFSRKGGLRNTNENPVTVFMQGLTGRYLDYDIGIGSGQPSQGCPHFRSSQDQLW